MNSIKADLLISSSERLSKSNSLLHLFTFLKSLPPPGKIVIDKPYPFALIKVVDPDLKELINSELMCGKSKVKILKPEWI